MPVPYDDEDYAVPNINAQPTPAQQAPPERAVTGVPEYDAIHAQPEGKAETKSEGPENVVGYLTASSGKKHYLKPGENHIGRGEVDLIVQDPTVSRSHAVLEVDTAGGRGNYRYFLMDNGFKTGTRSKNGTYVVGRTTALDVAERVSIFNGSQFVCGREKFTLHSDT